MCVENTDIPKQHKSLMHSTIVQASGSRENVPVSPRQDMSANISSIHKKSDKLLWFAMSATFGRELKAKEFLEQNDVRCFVPLRYRLVRVRGKGKVRKLVPAISNLIFVHCTKGKIQTLKSELSYLQYHTMPDGGRNVPVVVPKDQMEQFIAVCNTFNEKMTFISPDEINLAEGTRVRIVGGAFGGVEGTFVRVEKGKQKHVVVLVEGIAAVVLAKVSDGYLEVLKN